jgi:hypothetical protein
MRCVRSHTGYLGLDLARAIIVSPIFCYGEDNKPQILKTTPPHQVDFIRRGDGALTTRISGRRG